jgi:putative peptidoglycan lipid II flippase
MTLRKTLWQSALIIALATALSRLLGLLRDVTIADVFGASASYDAYVIAFALPHLLRSLLAEGALANAFIPIFSERLAQSREEADRFASNVLTLALFAFPLIVILGIWLAPHYIPFLADGFSPAKQSLAIHLTTITFPFIALVGIAALFMGIQNSYGGFFAPAFAPVLFNLGMIAGALLIASHFQQPIYGLAIGALLGGLGQLLFQTPFAGRHFCYHFRFDPFDPGVRQLLKLMLPAVLGLVVIEVNFLVDNKLASRLSDGSIAALQYASRLFQLPLGVFAISIATAILPQLSRHAAQGQTAAFSETVRAGLRASALVLFPAIAGLYALGIPIIRLLFEHGHFQSSDTLRTGLALQFFLVGLMGYGVSYVINRAFYALQETRTPILVSMAVMVVNVALDYLLIGPLGLRGLALATSTAGLAGMTLLFTMLSRRLQTALITRELGYDLLKMALISAIMGLLTHLFYSLTTLWLSLEVLRVGLAVIVGLSCYGGLAWLTGLLPNLPQARPAYEHS